MNQVGRVLAAGQEGERKGLRNTMTSGVSLVVHGAILAGLVAVSTLSVEPMARPSNLPELRPVFFLEGGAPPPLPAPLPGPGDTPSNPDEPDSPPEEMPDEVQPRDLPVNTPVSQGSAAGSGQEGDEGGHPEGVEGGREGGIPGGHPEGVGWGDTNGIPGGSGVTPGGVLQGLPDAPSHLTGDIRAPEKTFHVSPAYPEMARKARAEGTVILQIVIGRGGDVEEVSIAGSSPLFDMAAVEAVRKWKYEPALQDGRPVRVFLTVRVEFRLR